MSRLNKPSITDRARYWFDRTMSRGPIALIAWLGLITLLVIVVTSVAVWLIGTNSQETLIEQIWSFAMLSLEPDAITFGHWTFRIATLIIVFTSILVLSALIGILTTGMESRLATLRKGRSKVLESNHTIILGWSPKVFSVISELLVANENQRKTSIVVLGNKDKVEMEDEIRDKVGPSGKTRIICRSGDPLAISDLSIVGLSTSKSVIIIIPEGKEQDSTVIKTLLAIAKDPQRRKDEYHIVAEIRDPKNLDLGRIVAGKEAELVLTGGLVSRIVAQTCRQSGLSTVYTELMDFSGDEIYFSSEESLVGWTFGDALMAYEDSTVIGIRPSDGPPKLNPPMHTQINPGDEVIAISADDDTVRISGRKSWQIQEEQMAAESSDPSDPEHVLILGWNWRGSSIVNQLDHYVPHGSTVMLVSDNPAAQQTVLEKCSDLSNLTCDCQIGDTTDRATLEQLMLEKYDHVVLLASSENLSDQQTDARTLATLLHLRDIADRQGLNYSVVSEMLDDRNRELAEIGRADDFIVSDRLVSLLLAQISENKQLGPVFSALFDPEGSEIYLKPAARYVILEEDLNFYTVTESAKRRGEVALGYRIGGFARDADQSHGVVVNPVKSEHISFAADDKIIVLAEN